MSAPLRNVNGNGIRVPAWAMTASAIGLAVFLAGVRIGAELRDIKEAQRASDTRLCRIEAAVRITQWYSCTDRPASQRPAQAGTP